MKTTWVWSVNGGSTKTLNSFCEFVVLKKLLVTILPGRRKKIRKKNYNELSHATGQGFPDWTAGRKFRAGWGITGDLNGLGNYRQGKNNTACSLASKRKKQLG